MKMYGGVEVQLHTFLASALGGGEWSASCPSHFTSGKESFGTHWLGGWVGPGPVWIQQKREKYLSSCWESNTSHLVRSLVTILSELSHLHHSIVFGNIVYKHVIISV